jgi:hypothetical protein
MSDESDDDVLQSDRESYNRAHTHTHTHTHRSTGTSRLDSHLLGDCRSVCVTLCEGN